MNIEYEATFPNVRKDNIRKKLSKANAELVRAEFTQRRYTFNLPEGNKLENAWVRVRDEGDKVTMSLKSVVGDKIHSQKEIMLEVDNFEEAKNFLNAIGCQEKSYQESKRELWELDGVEITIDEWPFLEPFVEVEASTEHEVKEACKKVGFDYDQALFCAIDKLYNLKYNLDFDTINNKTPKITFDMENPFEK